MSETLYSIYFYTINGQSTQLEYTRQTYFTQRKYKRYKLEVCHSAQLMLPSFYNSALYTPMNNTKYIADLAKESSIALFLVWYALAYWVLTKQEIKQYFFSYVSKNASLPKSLYRVSIIYWHWPTYWAQEIRQSVFFLMCQKRTLFHPFNIIIHSWHETWGVGN